MLGGIAGQGGFNTVGKVPQTRVVSNNTTSLVDVVNVPSGSGFFMSASFGSKAIVYADVVIDGTYHITNSTRLIEGSGITMVPMCRYESSLVIRVKSSTTAEYASATAVYYPD